MLPVVARRGLRLNARDACDADGDAEGGRGEPT
jgi:hypothetical protein